MTAAAGLNVPGGHDLVAGGDLKRYPVPFALPRQALLAPCRVPETSAAKKRPAPDLGGQPDRLGDRVALADHQVAAEFAQLLAQHRDGLGEEPARFGGTVSAGSTTNSGTACRAFAQAPESAGLS